MKTRWLLVWLLAPLLPPGAMVIYACSLRWYLQEADAPLCDTPAEIRNGQSRNP